MSGERVLLQELSWPQVRELQRADPIVIIPAGSIEQHGPHLPLEVDSRIAKKLAEAVARKLQGEIAVIVTPVINPGFSGEHMTFPGTLSLTPDTFMLVAREILLSLFEHKFNRFLFLNAHGGNEEALKLVAHTVRQQKDVLVAVSSYWQLAREEIQALRKSPGSGINHGGEEETSLMLFLQPDLVNMEVAKPNPLRWRSPYLSGTSTHDAAVVVGRRRSDIAPAGHNGDPTMASAEKGKLLFEAIVEAIAHFVRDFREWRLDHLTLGDRGL